MNIYFDVVANPPKNDSMMLSVFMDAFGYNINLISAYVVAAMLLVAAMVLVSAYKTFKENGSLSFERCKNLALRGAWFLICYFCLPIFFLIGAIYIVLFGGNLLFGSMPSAGVTESVILTLAGFGSCWWTIHSAMRNWSFKSFHNGLPQMPN